MPHRPRPRVVTAFLLAVALLLVASPPVSAGAPTDRLRALFADVNAVLVDPTTEGRPLERVARIRSLVTEVTDIGSAAAAALGRAWQDRTAAERDEFITLFAELIERAYVGRLAGAVRATGGLAMTYLDEAVAGDGATVKTALRGLGGHDTRVEYYMTLRDGRWRVRDIVLDGVSTVENYRAQFTRMLQRESYAGLVRILHAKLAEDSVLFARLELRPPPATPARPDRVVHAAPLPDVVAPPLPEEVTPLVSSTRTDAREPRATARAPARPAPVQPATSSPDVVATRPAGKGSAIPSPAFAVSARPFAGTTFDPGVWLALLGFLAGVALVYVGWRAPAR